MFKIQKGYDKSNRTFRIPDELIAKLEQLAYKNNLSVNALVVQCLEYAIDNLDEDGTGEEKPDG